MVKEAYVKLTCRQCGREFALTTAEKEFYEQKGFTLPTHCKECRSAKQNHSHYLLCSQCGAEIEKGAPIYCNACLESVSFELERKTKQSQMAASAVHTKLQAIETQKTELEELLRQKEQLVAELELKINNLSQDLDKTHQFYAASGWLQPVLDEIGERLKDLELAQREVNQRMLQTIRIMKERYDNLGLLEIIKRNLRQYLKQGA